MKRKNLEKAIAEAARFLAAANTLIEKADKGNDALLITFGSKWSGAVRRASLDLTRALADMRSSKQE